MNRTVLSARLFGRSVMGFDRAEALELATPGLSIAALAWGPEDGVPVLGLHGWLDNAATMAGVGPALEECRLVSIDFPGHGESDHRPRGQSYHFVDLIPTIFDAADELGWNKFSILGHSMGAAASFLAAAARPERVGRVVAIDGLGPWSTPPDQTADQLSRGLQERGTLLEKSKRRFERAESAVGLLAERYGLTDDEVRPLIERGIQRTEQGDWMFTYDLLLRSSSLVRFTETQVLDCMESVRAPCLLIRPTDGWPVPDTRLESRIDAVENLVMHELDGRHHIHLQKPRRIARVATNFLTSSS